MIGAFTRMPGAREDVVPSECIVRDLTTGRGTMSLRSTPDSGLSPRELRDLRCLAGFMVPADADYGLPGADDEIIFADIIRSLGRDAEAVRAALQRLQEIAGADLAGLDAEKAEAAMLDLLSRDDSAVKTLGRAVLQCYYRDDRVLRGLGIEPVAPFPKGRPLEQGDWSLLDAVRGRPQMWRDDRDSGA
jgi:hypothetical protein